MVEGAEGGAAADGTGGAEEETTADIPPMICQVFLVLSQVWVMRVMLVASLPSEALRVILTAYCVMPMSPVTRTDFSRNSKLTKPANQPARLSAMPSLLTG